MGKGDVNRSQLPASLNNSIANENESMNMGNVTARVGREPTW